MLFFKLYNIYNKLYYTYLGTSAECRIIPSPFRTINFEKLTSYYNAIQSQSQYNQLYCNLLLKPSSKYISKYISSKYTFFITYFISILFTT